MIRCGDTFLIPAPTVGRPHLWIVITDPDPETSQCVVVSITTLRHSKDQTVILQAGEHPFIRHQSVVYYQDAQIIDARRLESEEQAGNVLRKERCQSSLLDLVQRGLIASDFTPNNVRAFCENCW